MATSNSNPSSGQKSAIIIANGNYESKNKLSYPINNANDLSKVLASINFTTTTICDVSREGMANKISDFRNKINCGDLILFYYSGHVYEVNGKKYLLPINDSNIKKDGDVEDFAINFDRIVTRVAEKNVSNVNIFIVDYCSPYVLVNEPTAKSRTVSKGLSQMQPPREVFIQFAYGANQINSAAIGLNRNSLFTKHLIRNITQENVPISEVFQLVTDAVYRESNQRQRPFSMNGLKQHRQVCLNEVVPARLRTQDFLTEEPLLQVERKYYERCKEYYYSTRKPLISIANEVLDNRIGLNSSIIKFGIDEDCRRFDVQEFLTSFCGKTQVNMDDIVVKKIQVGSVIMTVNIHGTAKASTRKRNLQLIFKSFTDNLQDELGKMKAFFIFMGPEESLSKMQRFQEEIYMNPQFNRTYVRGKDFWLGALNDGKNRGTPYYCPVGWKRWSFYVTDNFDEKFNGWCICYHGTKFAFGLSILLNGLKPAHQAVHGKGLYVTPSINYASHPRYAEAKEIPPSIRNTFKSGKYIQYVLECRVRRDSIKKVLWETLACPEDVRIDPNIENGRLEWVIENNGRSIVDFNDPESPIVCTGMMIRVTDDHPGLLPESKWWFRSDLFGPTQWGLMGVDYYGLMKKIQRGTICNIIFD